MKLSPAERRMLLPLLKELGHAVEELLLAGLTTASEATRQIFHVAFQEASRMRLLRLGSTLRGANEELGRFTRNEPDFSRKRLCFFLNRAWLLSHGLSRAVRANDEVELDRLLWTPASVPVERLEMVTLGVAKKVATAFCAFEFRLRTVRPAGKIPAGRRLAWSCIFPVKPGADIPAEAYLHLPQKQKFKADIFLEKKVVVLDKAAVALDDFGGGRVSLGDQSTVTPGDDFSDWEGLSCWSPADARARIHAHQPGPFDLEVEVQEEVVLDAWQVGAPQENAEGQKVYPITEGAAAFDAVVSPGPEGKGLDKALGALRKKKRRPPLFGLMHYQRCRLILQPLAVFEPDGPRQLMLSAEKLDRAALLKALQF